MGKSLKISNFNNFSKIILFEDDYGNIVFKNLRVLPCKSEQEGIEYLMMGNFIKQVFIFGFYFIFISKVSSTPMNQCSSRSHCVFTICLEGKEIDGDVGFVSKMHLVYLIINVLKG